MRAMKMFGYSSLERLHVTVIDLTNHIIKYIVPNVDCSVNETPTSRMGPRHGYCDSMTRHRSTDWNGLLSQSRRDVRKHKRQVWRAKAGVQCKNLSLLVVNLSLFISICVCVCVCVFIFVCFGVADLNKSFLITRCLAFLTLKLFQVATVQYPYHLV